VIAHVRTHEILQEKREELASGLPSIEVVLPTRTYEEKLMLQVGDRVVELYHFNVHTEDGTVLFLPEEGLLFAGDTLEDTATYIDDAANMGAHRKELERMARLPITKILPAHGSPDRIATGGYSPAFIDATLRYMQVMDEPVPEPVAWEKSLKDVVLADVEAGNLIYFEEYENVHQSNMDSIRAVRQKEL
jgi:cyclase